MHNWNKKMLTYIVFLGLMVILIGNRTIVAESKTDIVKLVELLQQDKDLNIAVLLVAILILFARTGTTNIEALSQMMTMGGVSLFAPISGSLNIKNAKNRQKGGGENSLCC